MNILEMTGTAYNIGKANFFILNDTQVSILFEAEKLEPIFLFYTREYHPTFVESQLAEHERYNHLLKVMLDVRFEELNEWNSFEIPESEFEKRIYRKEILKTFAENYPDPYKEFKREVDEYRTHLETHLALEAATTKGIELMSNSPQEIQGILRTTHALHRNLASVIHQSWRQSSIQLDFLFPKEH